MSFDENTFECKSFQELSLDELYSIMRLRQEVFVVEQDCPYLDADGKDQASWHLMCYDEHKVLVAYARLIPKGISYQEYASIGRVVNAMAVRGKNVGRLLMQTAIEKLKELDINDPIKISAQSYLLRFYQSFGFEPIGEEYLEDGIPHTAMIL